MNKEREHTISRVTLLGAIANLLLCAFKMAAGIIGRSSAMVADAVHSLSDLVSDVIVLVMVKISSRGSDKGHDYGHGKFETLATAFVSLLLLAVGIKLLLSAISGIRGAIGGREINAPSMIALWAALVSIAVKEILYQWTSRIGKKVDSPVMMANAWHHRSDALSSVGSSIGIAGAIFLGGKWTVLDPVASAVISILIVVVSIKMVIPALEELTEASLSEDVENQILKTIESVPGIKDAHALKTRRIGTAINIDVHIVVDPQMSVFQAHEIACQVENTLRGSYGPETQVSVHVEPYEDAL